MKDKTTDKAYVLFVDDEDSIRSMAVYGFPAFGFDVLEATDGQDALQLYKENSDKIDAIITDIHMEKLDGLTFYQLIRKYDKSIPVIFCSGFGATPDIKKFLVMDELLHYTDKPYKIIDLVKMITEILKNRNKEENTDGTVLD
jgi:two-component system cell cycle sensor histidine kinase/response regulator CckA